MNLIRRAVREELALRRGPQLATVTALSAHSEDDDTSNYECDVRLKHDGLELPKVPIAISHAGAAAPPRVGDLVLVTFVDGELQQPLVSGRFYTDDDKSRAPLFKEGDVLFEQRLSDGTLNHMRMASDGSLFLQRDVKKPEDNSDFAAGIRIDHDGLIELKSGDDFVLTIDPQGGKVTLLAKDKPVEVTCQKMKIDGDVEITKTLTVQGDGTISGTGKISHVTISGTEISGS
jgi:phage baseplate assembly protein gpV